MKKYFREAVLLYGMVAEAKGEKVPPVLRNAVSFDLLPWWPQKVKREGRKRRYRRESLSVRQRRD